MLRLCPRFCNLELVVTDIQEVVLHAMSKNTEFSLNPFKSMFPSPHFFIPKEQGQTFYPVKIYSQFKSWKLHTGIIILVNQEKAYSVSKQVMQGKI